MIAERTNPLPYAERFAAVAASLPGHGVPWLRALREESIAGVRASGVPTQRVERWRYTNLRPLLQTSFAEQPDAAGRVDLDDAGLDGALPRIVFHDGVLRPDLSSLAALPAGATVASLGEMLAREPEALAPYLDRPTRHADDAFVALNTAFMADGYVLRIGPGVDLGGPLHVVFVGGTGSGVAFHPRNLILAERGSRVSILESHVAGGSGTYWSNALTQIRIGEGAGVRHCQVLADGAEAFHIGRSDVNVGADGRYDGFVLTIGGRLVRNEIRTLLDGEGASCRLAGAYLLRDRQHCDNTTEIIHAKPRTESREVYKGVLDGRSRAVFQGKIAVREGAQKSDGHQLNKTLLLSDQAEIDTKPELEILADDVKCSHGAAAGELEADAMFYLRARGIDAAAARRLLIEAFVGEVVDEIADKAARSVVARRIAAWLAGTQAEEQS